MYKLLSVSLFIAIGIIVGSLFYKYYKRRTLPLAICLVLGVLGAFAGLWISDLADLRLIGNVTDGVIFATTGSVLLLGLNLFLRGRS